MVVVDLTPEEELAANLTLNNPEIEGKWDEMDEWETSTLLDNF